MDVGSILTALKEERDRIDAAIAALSTEGGNRRGGGAQRAVAGYGRRRTRRLSAAARRKISEAAKARWIKAKKAGRNSL